MLFCLLLSPRSIHKQIFSGAGTRGPSPPPPPAPAAPCVTWPGSAPRSASCRSSPWPPAPTLAHGSSHPPSAAPAWPARCGRPAQPPCLLESGSSCKQKSIKYKIVELLLLLGDLSVYLLLGLGEQQLRMKHTVLLLLDPTLGLQMAPLLVQLVDGAASIS